MKKNYICSYSVSYTYCTAREVAPSASIALGAGGSRLGVGKEDVCVYRSRLPHLVSVVYVYRTSLTDWVSALLTLYIQLVYISSVYS